MDEFPLQRPPEAPPVAAPTPTAPEAVETIPMFDISGQQPVLGDMHHDDVYTAVQSGKFAFPKGQTVPVISPDGELGDIPAEDAPSAFSQGYEYATPQRQKEVKYGSAGQQALTAVEGIAQGVAGPLAPLVQTQILGMDPEAIRAREEINPITKGVGEAAGMVGSMVTGVGAGALMTKAGRAAEAAAAFGNANRIAKVGSEAVKQAAEMAVYQTGDEISKAILSDPDLTAESAIANVGLASALGAGTGAVLTGVVSPLWEATAGKHAERILSGLSRKLNGEGDQALINEAKELGVPLSPEIEAAMSQDPMLRNIASSLNQSDTTKAGRSFQEAAQAFRTDVSDTAVRTLGKEPGELGVAELSKYETGKDLGETLAKEWSAKIDPVVEELEALKNKFANQELPRAKIEKRMDASNPYQIRTVETVTPGAAEALSEKISMKAMEEGWLAQASSEEARMVRSVLKELKSQNTIGDLVKMGQNLGNRTKSTLPFGVQTPLSRAGTIVRGIIRDTENELIMLKAGIDSPDTLIKYRGALQGYKEAAVLKDALNDRLKISPSVGKYSKALREAATTDGESLLNKLKGDKDANLLAFLQENFPETAAKVRQYHVDQLLKTASEVGKGKNGSISLNNLMKNMEKMSPELRDFIATPEVQAKLQNLKGLAARLDDQNHNWSNTARTVDKILGGTGGTAMGLIAALTGQGVGGVLLAPILGSAGKEAHASAKLALLKYLGSNQPIKAEGFKAAVDFMEKSIKGQTALNKGAAAVFKSGVPVIASANMPSAKDREKLDKAVAKAEANPQAFMESLSQGQTGYYMPEAKASVSKSTTQAFSYLQSMRPRPFQPSPLDMPIEPSKEAVARYNRALDIATNPMSVLQHVKDGTLQGSDLFDLKAMYPALYRQMAGKMTESMVDAAKDGVTIPYKTKIAVSLFLGQPLDSSMKPESIVAAQSTMQAPLNNPSAQAPRSLNESAAAALNKSATRYQTPGQSAEQDRGSRK